jgi:hypothetical protein
MARGSKLFPKIVIAIRRWFFANFSGRLSVISRARRKWLCERTLWPQVAGTRTQALGARQENLEKSRWKNSTRQTDSLAIKCKYRHCLISMPVFDALCHQFFADTRKLGLLAATAKFGPESYPGNKVMVQRSGGPHPTRLENKW